MRHRLILIAAVAAGLFGAAISSYARDCGCYAETRAEGISLCERGFHQKAIEYFEAAKKCSDAPSRNDIDKLIAQCVAHMTDFRITKLELGNTDQFLEPICAFELPLYQDNLLFLTPRITYNAAKAETILLGVKIYEPDGLLSGGDENEYSYTSEVQLEPGTDQVYQLIGWGKDTPGSYDPGDYRIEIWSRGKLLVSRDFKVLAGRDPDESHYAIAGEAGDDDENATALLLVKGEIEPTVEFGKLGAIVHLEVENNTGVAYDTALLPDFCSVENVTPTGFDLVCQPNKSPAARADWFWVFADESYVTVNVKQATYATANYLKVDGSEESASCEFDWKGGKLVFFVQTDGPDYTFWGLPGFCQVDKKTDDSFFLVCEENPMKDERSDYFYVQVADLQVQINVRQAGNPDGESYEDYGDEDQSDFVDTYMGSENIISDPERWLAVLEHMMDNPTTSYDDGAIYKGEKNDEGLRNGYGIYYWPVKSYYIGQWENGERNGMGIYIIGDYTYNFSNCPGARIYVGHWENNLANGVGSCYDEEGNLIYDGVFTDGMPGDDYPNGDEYSGYRFQIYHIDNDPSRWYVGETHNTERTGWGLLMWDDFDCCFGKWIDDNRTNQLFMSRDGSFIEMRDYSIN